MLTYRHNNIDPAKAIPNVTVKLPVIMKKAVRYKNSFLLSQRRLNTQMKHWQQTKKVKLRM